MYALTIFISAFLLFQVQPLISKRILPWFGGTPSVWTTSILFFQVVLLAGYSYAHFISTRLGQRRQVILHVLLLSAALLFMPVYPDASWKPGGPEHPTWRILLLLTATVGLPYLTLSATSPLLQKWFSLTRRGASPYRLYALSNAGSLLALVSYPALVEPAMSSRVQAVGWSVGWGIFAALCALCAVGTWNPRTAAEGAEEEPKPSAQPQQTPPRWGGQLLWLLLPATASLMLLAVTNQMCQDVAVVPFLWVLPLGLYLLSFIICFDKEKWYYRPVFLPALVLAAAAMGWVMFAGARASMVAQIGVYSAGLFACCMVCHGELARLKPPSRYLTSFYLMVSAGGALGGIFVSLVAPHLFKTYLELNVGIWGCCALAVVALWYGSRLRSPQRPSRRVPLCFSLCLPGLLALAVVLGIEASQSLRGYTDLSRNFYGILRVAEYDSDIPEKHRYMLLHGRIIHGWQYVSDDRRHLPTSYFGEKSGVGLALLHYPRESGLRVGIVGLGTGTLAAYGQEGDHYTFYEINPDVVALARTRFTYLAESKAAYDIVLGDARLSLERQEPQQFDVLILDAFSSDAIPVHLLTREAFSIYLRHLRPQGVIAVQISNRHVDLRPIVWGLAQHFDLHAALVDSKGDEENVTNDCTWILTTANPQFLAQPEILEATAEDMRPSSTYLWTDDYSNLFRIMKWWQGRSRR